MKKALVVFLILAVAGGLFADPVVSGNLSTGIGIGIDNTDAQPVIDYARDRLGGGMQANVTVAATPKPVEGFGTYGADITIRANLGRFSSDGAFGWAVDGGKLWWTPNDFLRIDIGSGGPGGFGSLGGVDRSQDILGSDGLKVRLTPVTGLTIGANIFYGKAVKDIDKVKYGFGAKYAAADLFTAVATVTYDLSQAVDQKKLNWVAGVDFGSFSALKAIGFTKLAVDAASDNGMGANNSDIAIGPAIGFAVGGLTLGANAKLLLWTGTDADPGYLPIRIHGSVGYKVNDVVSLGAEARYVIGNKPDWNYQKAGDGLDAAFNGEKAAGLAISPQITFNVGPTIVVGYNFRTNLTDPAPASTEVSTQHGIYAALQVGF